MSQQPHNFRREPTTLAELQKEVEHYERGLAQAMASGQMTEDDALKLYADFQKTAEAKARQLKKAEKRRSGTSGSDIDKIGQDLADAAMDVKYGLLNLAHKAKYLFKNRRTLDMIGSLDIEGLRNEFAKRKYLCNIPVATGVWMALQLGKPIILEGDPGVGKTEIAKVLSDTLGAELIRLQCYEGLDENKALYEWNYSKQLLALQGKGKTTDENIYGDDYLMERPLLKAIRSASMPVLLIDEIDKTDEEFEAFLLEILSDFQVSIPELGTIKAQKIPPVVLTSNGMRELSDALRRRCEYLHIEYPDIDTEAQILIKKADGIAPDIAKDIARAMATIRKNCKLRKNPSISESIDLAQALVKIDAPKLDPRILDQLTNLFLKNREDQAKFMQQGGSAWALRR